ncbi:uncharacterized protein MEPE_04393 [Melanopsichium pennsylvanicum]|uniref:DUF300-domain-containing protein n=2 Tax=Melanopsichium pennsylvanicum TaxID=63383 RepID=A0AAJ4XNN9_9BASI|nr:uncharacterized protein MEPE_04393 [Melanopsichium pennsylvanicum]
MVNFTCPTIPDKPSDPKPFFQNGSIDLKAHDVGWLVCGIMALIATVSSIWLIVKHLTYYTCPQQQRHIVRLLVMVPVYAIVSFMSYLFYQEALYYQTIRDCYEAVLVTSFFYLILAYTGDTRAEQHAVFRSLDTTLKGFWVWPLGRCKYSPSGLHFLWVIKISVLQYAIVRPLCTLIAVGTEYFGYYCLHSWMPWFTHVWCALFISISVTLAMYCLIQLYFPVRTLVDPYKPIWKFLSIKTIVFLTFWQDTFLSFLVSFNVIKETEYFTAEQIQAGINALLQCFWMLLFGFIHIKAFSYLPYRPEDRKRTTSKARAMLDALDFRDWFWEMKESTRYIAAKSKRRNYTLAEDLRANRHEHLLKALGKERKTNLEAEMDLEKAAMPTFWKNPQVAQFWTPSADGSGSEMSKHISSSSFKQASGDAYSSRPSPASRNLRQDSRLTHTRSTEKATDDTTAWRSSRDSRAAELQRLVAELDLQDVDTSMIHSEDHEYAYPDSKYELSALVPIKSASKQFTSPVKDFDLHPELTQYHTSTVALANVPSLTYNHTSSSSNFRRAQDLSAVAEEDQAPLHAHSGIKVAPGIGAFGIASWLGWSGNAAQSYTHTRTASEQPHRNDYVRPGDGYAGQQYGADVGGGGGWWKDLWNGSLSNANSREPSMAEIEDDKAPLNTAATNEKLVVMRQVIAGSWGGSNTPQHRQRSLPQPPSLQIQIDTEHNRGGEANVDSAKSPSSRISPHADSPLSRLIQTSRDSFSSLSRDEVHKALLTSLTSPSKTVIMSTSSGSLAHIQAVPAVRPSLALRHPSFAPSSQHPSVSRVTSTSTRSAPKTTVCYTIATTHSAYESTVHEMMSNTDSKHQIKFFDALLPPIPANVEDEATSRTTGEKKALPPAVGPKGKLFNLVLPGPLSPARYPYGKEGEAPASTVEQGNVVSPVSRREPSVIAGVDEGEGGTLKWVSHDRPVKQKWVENAAMGSVAKLPEGKGVIVVGGMSLSQAKAAAAVAGEDTRLTKQQQQQQQQVSQSQAHKKVTSAPFPSASILSSTPTSDKKGEGKLILPAPSKLASGDAEDPYGAGPSANTPPRSKITDKKRRKSSGIGTSVATSATKISVAGTAFEVGSIVPREAVVRASMPIGYAGSALSKNYYDSMRQGGGPQAYSPGRGMSEFSQGGFGMFAGGQQHRHSYTPPMMSGAQPAMLPPHPGQPPQQQYPQQQRFLQQSNYQPQHQHPHPQQHHHQYPHQRQQTHQHQHQQQQQHNLLNLNGNL